MNITEIIVSTDINKKESIQMTIDALMSSNLESQSTLKQIEIQVQEANYRLQDVYDRVHTMETAMREAQSIADDKRSKYMIEMARLNDIEDIVRNGSQQVDELNRQINHHNDIIQAYVSRLEELEENHGVDNELSHLIIPE